MSEPVVTRELAARCGFTEGPVQVGDRIVFTSINRGVLYSAAFDGSGCEPLVETGGGPNGLASGSDGGLWVAQNGGRVMESKSFAADPGIQRLKGATLSSCSPDGVLAPNDLAFGPDGRLWFTDPHGRLMDATESPSGKLRALDTATGEFEVIADGLRHPNGLCFSADGQSLFFSDTKDLAVYRVDLTDTGWGQPILHATLPFGEPDGMAFDEAGGLWVAATSAEGLAVLHPNGEWSLVSLGLSFPTNLCFAGADRRTIVVTAARGGRVLAFEVDTPGLALQAG